MVFRAGIPSPKAQSEAEMRTITGLMHRSGGLRQRLLAGSIALSFGGGALVAFLYVEAASLVYGRVLGAAFALGAILTFMALRRSSKALARRQEDRWIAELARASAVDPEALAEAVAMLR